MNFPIPLKPTPFLTSQGAVSPEWYKYLNSLAGRVAFEIPDDLIFANNVARDAYFAANPDKLFAGIKIVSGSQFQVYDGVVWQDFTTVVQGAPGPAGETGPVGPKGDPSNTIADAINLTWANNVATVDADDWNTYQEFTIEYNGAAFVFNKDLSETVQTQVGGNVIYQCVMDVQNRTFTFSAVGSTSGNMYVLVVPEAQVFETTTARNAYFTANPDKLALNPYSLVNKVVGLYTGSLVTPITYDDTKWTDGALVIKGQDGANGTNGVNGADGADGYSPTVTVIQNDSTAYKLRITTKTGSFDTPNLLNTNLINDDIESSTNTWSSNKIKSLLTGQQSWLPAVSLKSNLPTVSDGAWSPATPAGWPAYDATKTYLVKVVDDTAENIGTYQMTPGATTFTIFSRDTEWVSEEDLIAALAGYKLQIKNSSVTAAATGVYTVTVGPDQNIDVNATSKTGGSITINHPAIAEHTGLLECSVVLRTGSFACPVTIDNHLVANEASYSAEANAIYQFIFWYVEGASKWTYGVMKLA